VYHHYLQIHILSYSFIMRTFEHSSKTSVSLLYAVLFLFYTVIIVRRAWIAEDAFITFRTIKHFLLGYGLRWNILERVQSYTHPLWMLCVSFVSVFTHNIPLSALWLTVGFSVLTVGLFCAKLAYRPINAILGVLILSCSVSFIDYSTSGLENPLTHLLLGCFFLVYFACERLPSKSRVSRKQILLLSLITAFVAVNRMDAIVLLVFPLLYIILRSAVYRSPKTVDLSKILAACLGFLPLLVWELFSLLYYGFLFPNTAYAKLNTAIHPAEYMEQGWYYLLNSLSWDPITLLFIGSVPLYLILSKGRNRYHLCAGIGILFYLGYVIRIGGDFMSGRFLSAPFFCSIVLLGRIPLKPLSHAMPIGLLALLVSLQGTLPTLKTMDYFVTENFFDHRGISDERADYNQASSLFRANRKSMFPEYQWDEAVKKVPSFAGHYARCAVGRFGFYAPPEAHILDTCALSDPLLARLPYRLAPKGAWRIGHFHRNLPKGYPESVNGVNHLHDESLARYWDKLALVIRGDIFQWKRIWTIWKFALGKYDHYIQDYCVRHYAINYLDIRTKREEGTPWNAPGNYLLNRYGLGIMLGFSFGNTSSQSPQKFSVSLNGGHRYDIAYYRNGEEIAREEISPPRLPLGGLVIYEGQFPPEAIHQECDLVRIFPAASKGKHSVGHFCLTSIAPFHKHITELPASQAEGTPWNHSENTVLGEQDRLIITLGKTSHASIIEITADNNDDYQLLYFLDAAQIGQSLIPRKKEAFNGLSLRVIEVPRKVAERGYNILRIMPLSGDGLYSIGHIRLYDE
jgi:arabinofuranosyltransferase